MKIENEKIHQSACFMLPFEFLFVLFMLLSTGVQAFRCFGSISRQTRCIVSPLSRLPLRCLSSISGTDKSNIIEDPSRDKYLLQFDGGSRGNPGPGGAGAVIFDGKGKEIWNGYFYVGDTATNNQAEYTGLVEGVRQAVKMKVNHLVIQGDSLLVINQITNTWKVKNKILGEFNKEAKKLLKEIDYFEASHIPREENSRADELSNVAMDKRTNSQS
jgi:ribonuclease HI